MWTILLNFNFKRFWIKRLFYQDLKFVDIKSDDRIDGSKVFQYFPSNQNSHSTWTRICVISQSVKKWFSFLFKLWTFGWHKSSKKRPKIQLLSDIKFKVTDSCLQRLSNSFSKVKMPKIWPVIWSSLSDPDWKCQKFTNRSTNRFHTQPTIKGII